jgi:hypothetical protein
VLTRKSVFPLLALQLHVDSAIRITELEPGAIELGGGTLLAGRIPAWGLLAPGAISWTKVKGRSELG